MLQLFSWMWEGKSGGGGSSKKSDAVDDCKTDKDKPLINDVDYLNERLRLNLDSLANAEKIISEAIGITVAIFGGIGLAIVSLHGSVVKPFISVVLSIAVSTIGMLIATMFINLVNRVIIEKELTKQEISIYLEQLNAGKTREINDIINKYRIFLENNLKDPLNPSVKNLDIFKFVLGFIRVLMILFFVYSSMALVLMIICYEGFLFIW